ncbi:MAG: hypothetical protein II921_04090, partial [Treponema sp.]|nr:hypothetical protein [Treponema sp.]
MKKSFLVLKFVAALFAATLLPSCDSGGGGGSGGGTAASKSTKLSITLPSAPATSSADIVLGDLRIEDTADFYYEVYFKDTKNGKEYGPEGGKPGSTITFDDVIYSTYNFYLKIYIDKENDIELGIQSVLNRTVSETDNMVSFDLRLSDYGDFYFVSSQAELESAFTRIAGKGGVKAGDESTYGKIIVTKDFALELASATATIQYKDYSPALGAVMNLCGHTISSEKKVQFSAANEYIVFKNGKLKMKQLQLGLAGENDSSSVLTLDGVSVEQQGEAILSGGGLVTSKLGTVKITNGADVESDGICAYASGGTIAIDEGAKITCTSDVSTTVAVYCFGGAISADGAVISATNGAIATKITGGKFSAMGGTKIESTGRAIVVGGGTFILDASSAKSTKTATAAVGLSEGTLVMTNGSSVTSNKNGINHSGGTVVVNNSSVIGDTAKAEYQTGGTFVMVGGTLKTNSTESSQMGVYVSPSVDTAVFALLDSYTLDGTTYTATGASKVGSLYFTLSNGNGYLLFGGNSQIESFDSFFSDMSGQCYFGQVSAASGTAAASGFVSIDCNTDDTSCIKLLKPNYSTSPSGFE